MSAPVLQVEDLKTHFPIRTGILRQVTGHVRAVDGVTFDVKPGETLCVVGESGCGKSTLGRTILRLIEPTGGQVRLEGEPVTGLDERAMRPLRKRMQIVFQDPYASLNPRMRAGDIVAEPLENFGGMTAAQRRLRVAEMFAKVGLPKAAMERFPFEFSGGQRQRLGIARALVVDPKVIVADEPVSALDVSVQAQVLNLMLDLQEEFGVAYVFISHDLGVVEHIAHRVAVMYLGRIVEIGDRESLFDRPRHPYTQALISAAPIPDPSATRDRIVLQGDVPSPAKPPSGCAFHTRCPFAQDRCKSETPFLREAEDRPGHAFACHFDL